MPDSLIRFHPYSRCRALTRNVDSRSYPQIGPKSPSGIRVRSERMETYFKGEIRLVLARNYYSQPHLRSSLLTDGYIRNTVYALED